MRQNLTFHQHSQNVIDIWEKFDYDDSKLDQTLNDYICRTWPWLCKNNELRLSVFKKFLDIMMETLK